MENSILIINQSNGTDQEILDSITNFIQVNDDGRFYMSLVIDRPMSEDFRSKLNELESSSKNLVIGYNDSNLGLSPSRTLAVRMGFSSFNTEFNQILFGATNTKFISLSGNLADVLCEEENYPTVLKCSYDKDPFIRNTKFDKLDYVSLGEYVSNENKPDYSIMIPAKYAEAVRYIKNEKYYPEEIIMEEVLSHLPNDSCYRLRIRNTPFIKAWYNKGGMSMSFNREFMRRNSRGFFKRAEVLLKDFTAGRIQLDLNKVKYLMYDYVTFNSTGDKSLVMGTWLEPLYWEVIKSWVKFESADHRIIFKEDDYNPVR